MNVLVGALKVRVSATRGLCVSNSYKTFAGREHIRSPKPYLLFSWGTGVSSLAGRYMHSRAPSLGQAMREGQEEEVYRCRGTYACHYVQDLAELRIPEHRVVCYQCRISEPAARARRHTGRAVFVSEKAGTPKAESGDSDGLRRVQSTLLRWSVFVASHDGRQAELRLSAARVQEAPNVLY